jgi:hypothetical protein
LEELSFSTHLSEQLTLRHIYNLKSDRYASGEIQLTADTDTNNMQNERVENVEGALAMTITSQETKFEDVGGHQAPDSSEF